MKLFLLIGFIFSMSVAKAEVVEFHIKAGTGASSWNTEADSIKAKMGDTIRFFNDDSIVHQLHTAGSPCSHGEEMATATSWDCNVVNNYSSRARGPLYDHNHRDSKVWIEIVQ